MYMVDKDQYLNSHAPKQKGVSTVPNLTECYKDVSERLGWLTGNQKYSLMKQFHQLYTLCRKVPFAQHDKIKQDLDRMEKAEIICKVEHQLGSAQ